MINKMNIEERELLIAIANYELDSIQELQKNPKILQKRVEETKDRFPEVDIMDYYEDIHESWQLWERIIENPIIVEDNNLTSIEYNYVANVMLDYPVEDEDKNEFNSLVSMIMNYTNESMINELMKK